MILVKLFKLKKVEKIQNDLCSVVVLEFRSLYIYYLLGYKMYFIVVVCNFYDIKGEVYVKLMIRILIFVVGLIRSIRREEGMFVFLGFQGFNLKL